jgi:gas vesicle protein
MRMSDREEMQDTLANNIGWFVAGTVVGMTVAILLAPQSGKKTRQILTEKTQLGKDAVADKGKDVYDRSKEMIDQGRQLVEDAADLFDRGRKLVRGL